ncbi:MAG TPA: calcium/proton exchanger [Planctomycetota bacterium]|jgi:Ca2+:H+ antiporter|nr:calcium/proton exchanger [Planctomycetota bacterium]
MKISFKPSLHWLFAFIPVTVALEHVEGLSPPLLFFSAALAIVPIAALIVHSTEQIAKRTGDAVGGLLNATFGNAPELIIAMVALKAGLHEMVLASLVGAILANLLFAQGTAFILGGLRNHEQKFNASSTRLYSSMMLIAVISLIVPSAFSRFLAEKDAAATVTSLNTSFCVVLLVIYGLYLLFTLKTHADLFQSVGGSQEGGHEEHAWGMPRAIGSLLAASVLAAWMSEILVGAAEGTGHALGMSSAFIGMIFLALVGGAAESGSAIAMARKNKPDLAVGIAMGSCVQIALFVAPVLVFASRFVGPHPLTLNFNRAETGMLLFAVLLGGIVSNDGQSTWFKGVQLLAMYALFALLYFFIPT